MDHSHDGDLFTIITCMSVELQHYCGKSFSTGGNNSFKGEMLKSDKTEYKTKVQRLIAGIL